MHRASAVAVDEIGFRLVHTALGLRRRRHKPAPEALEALRREGSPVQIPGTAAPPVPDAAIEAFPEPRWLEPDLRVRFASPRPSPWPENDSVYIDVYRPGADWGSGMVLGYPGVLTGAHWINEAPFRWWARHVARQGLTFGLVHPPYHMSRTPPGFMSGELMFSGDILTIAHGYAQAACDLQAAVSWALTVVPRVGYWGASMGGLIGLTIAACEPRLSCCIPMIPPADVCGPLFRSTLCQVMREDFEAGGGTAADVHALMAPLDPFLHPPVMARDRVLLVAAQYDQVCYAADLERLAAAWGDTPLMQYPHGHLSIFRSRTCLRDMSAFLQTYLAGPRLVASSGVLAAAA